MRVLVVSQYFWPENFRINELVAELVKRGHQVTVLTGVPNYPEGEVFADFRRNAQAFGEYEGARVVRVPMAVRGQGKLHLMLNYLSFALSASICGLWKLRGQSFDFILTFEVSPITVGIPSAVMRWWKRAPQAFWVLDLWPDTLQALGVVRAPWMLNAVGRLVSWVYRRCDLILAQSRSFADNIRRYAGTGARIEYFPAWAEALFAEGADAPAAELSVAPDRFTVLFAGNIGEAQDFPAILDAAEALEADRRIRWAIVGDGRVADWIKGQIVERGLDHAVIMLGRHPLERMPEFFRHADALLVSLKDEPVFALTIPGKLQAYLAAGIPVLAMLNGEGGNIVIEADAGLVCPAGDAKGLAENVSRLANLSVSDRARLGANGRRFCKDQFDRDTLIDRLESWMGQLHQGRGGIARKKRMSIET